MSGSLDPASPASAFTDPAPAPAGFMGQSPTFFQNLANFGANLSVSANARNPNGTLQYGGGFAGPLGAATLANQQFYPNNPFAQAELRSKGLANQSAELQNKMAATQLPFAQALAKLQMQTIGGMAGGGTAPMGAEPDATQAPDAAPAGPAGPPTSLAQGIQSAEKSGLGAVNPLGYIGKYQLGAPELTDIGVYHPAPGEDLSAQGKPGNPFKYQGTFTIPGMPFKPMTVSQFLQNGPAQDAAFVLQSKNLDQQAQKMGLDQYIGKTVNGVLIDHNALMGGMHLAGAAGMKNWLAGAANPTDQNGTTIPRYINAMRGGGYPAVAGAAAQQAGGPQAGAPQAGGFSMTPEQALAEADKYDQMANNAAITHLGSPEAYANRAKAFREYGLAGATAAATANATNASKLAYAGPTAAAEASGKLPFTMETLRGPGSVLTLGGKPVVQIPQEVHTVDANGTPITRFVQPIEGVSGGSGSLPAPFQTGLAPGLHELIDGAGKTYDEEGAKRYQAAIHSQLELTQLDSDIDSLNQGGGWSTSGAGNNATVGWAKTINGAFQRLGGAPPFDPGKVGSWEQANKIVTRLGFEQAASYGSHEAQSIMNASVKATPGNENTPQGYKIISGGLHEAANREVDFRNFQTKWAADHGGNLVGSDVAFNKQSPPQMYANRAISQVNPIKVNTPGAAASLLPGTLFIGPDGVTRTVPPAAAQ